MNKKKISLIQAIMQLVALVSLFIPVSFIRYFTRSGAYYYDIQTYQYNESLFTATDISDNLIWGILLLLVSVVALTYFVLSFASKIQLIRKKFCIAIPCISLPLLVVCVITILTYARSGAKYSEVYGADWGFYLICALYLSIAILELYKHFSLSRENKLKQPKSTIGASAISSGSDNTPITQPPSNGSLDDLVKLKSLLDAGIITQEEFDAKKKQILGL